MDCFLVTNSHYQKYQGWFEKLSPIQLSFETQQQLRTMYEKDPNLTDLPLKQLQNTMLTICRQLIRKGIRGLTGPEIVSITKFALLKWAGIFITCRPTPKKQHVHPKQRLKIRLPKKPKLWNTSYPNIVE